MLEKVKETGKQLEQTVLFPGDIVVVREKDDPNQVRLEEAKHPRMFYARVAAVLPDRFVEVPPPPSPPPPPSFKQLPMRSTQNFRFLSMPKNGRCKLWQATISSR